MRKQTSLKLKPSEHIEYPQSEQKKAARKKRQASSRKKPLLELGERLSLKQGSPDEGVLRLHRHLLKLEQDMAFFNFIIQEVKELVSFTDCA